MEKDRRTVRKKSTDRQKEMQWAIDSFQVANLEVLLRRIPIVIGKGFKCPVCVLYLLEKDHLKFVSSVGLDAGVAVAEKIPVGQSFSGRLLDRGEPRLFRDVAPFLTDVPDNREPYFNGSVVASPLIFNQQIIGLIVICRPVPLPPFTVEDRDWLITYANQAAFAVECQRLADKRSSQLVKAQSELTKLNEQLRRDILRRRKAEDVRQESERRLADIIEFLPDATIVIDRDSKVIAWNRAMEVMTGVPKGEMLGRNDNAYAVPFYGHKRPMLIDYALHPELKIGTEYSAVRRTGDTLTGECFAPSLPPGDVHMSATASVLRDSHGGIIAAIECIRDNTERKKLAERLNRAEKMEGLGRLAGGVAHDLNNVLGVLVGYSELLAAKLPGDSPLRKYIDNIHRSSIRGAAIIQDLLTLARRGVTISEVVDLNRVVADYFRTPEFEKLRSFYPNVKIETDFDPGLLHIKGSPVHLGKTIMNLVSNAAEAMSGPGEIAIRTENRYLDRPLQGFDEMKEGEYVVLTVSDTGSGISEQDIGKIFEPFYTKKVMGRSGTGLGLAVVWGTVKDHNGCIDVRSEEGKGSSFTLYFPATRERLPAAREPASMASYMGEGEAILIVDDVEAQRELALTMLETLGYRVDTVDCGEAAVDYLKENKADLVVLDMIMDPGIDGLETYRRIIEIVPGQKAVIVSGYAETERVRQAGKLGAGPFVKKPYSLETIGLAIRHELDRE